MVVRAFSRSAPDPLAEGGVPSFETVFATYAPFLWRVLHTLGVPPSHLEDAVRDVFIVVHRRLHEFEARAQLSTWLYAVAYRTAQNYRRHATRHDQHDRLDVEYQAQGFDPCQQAGDAEAAHFIDTFAEGLDEAKRPVFVFCVLEGASVPQVAEALGINLNTAYSRLRSVRLAFRQALLALQESP